MYSQWVWADPIVGIVGSIVIASWAYGLVRDSGAVLLDVRADEDLEAVIRDRIETKGDRITDSLDAPPSEHEDAQPLGDQIADRGPAPDASAQSRETREMVHSALQKLSPELREAVILRDLQDMDYREIATALRVPEGTVKSRINRGRAELARLLQRTYKQVI